MTEEAIEPEQAKHQPLKGLMNDFGIDNKIVGDIIKATAQDYIKSKIGVSTRALSNKPGSRLIAEIKAAWWYLGAFIFATGLSLIAIIVLYKISMKMII
jgi:hypothetical protein